MKNFPKSLLFLGLTTFTVATAVPQFPFPQNKAYPYGNTFKAAVTDSIQSHFNTWKKAWYTEAGEFYALYKGASENANKQMPAGTARVISPNANPELTVSEGIGYGMLLMVYMSTATNDYQAEFDKLWKYWKCYGKDLNGNGCNSWNGQGMDWQVDNFEGDIGSGSASDAEFDAAVALIMASKQWGNTTYLNDAKKLISWIKENDMNGAHIKPGSNWNPAFNPSYAAVGAFQLFAEVTGDSYWQNATTTAISDVQLCQNSVTGLMPDWCTWDTHKPTNNTGAAVVSGYFGFYNDATRTPWRMAWGYSWYGIAGAKASNDKIINWLDSASYGYAGMILPGYNVDGSSDADIYVSSDFTGGLGLSMLSADNPKSYLEGLYYTLANTKGKDSLRAATGEEYFASTLNVLYMLLLTGNMPNLYNTTNYTDFVPNPTAVQTPKEPAGILQDTSLHPAISGLTHWGVYADRLGKTVMYPDSGSSGIFLQPDGSYYASMELFIGPEPTYTNDPNLKYPFAGLACSFDEKSSYFDLSDLDKVRITYRSKGVIRFSLLDLETLNQEKEGGEPGYYLHPTDEWKTIDIDISYNDKGDFNSLTYPAWTNLNGQIYASDVLKAVRGIKFDAKMQKSGFATFDLAEICLFDKSGQIITSMKGINGIQNVKAPVQAATLSRNGNVVHFEQVGLNAKLRVFDLNGNLISNKSVSGTGDIALDEIAPARGLYILRLSTSKNSQFLKVQK